MGSISAVADEKEFFEHTRLIKAKNLKPIFRDIRNFLAGRVTGATRDETLVKELMKIIFCKIKDEMNYFERGKLILEYDMADSDLKIYKDVREIFSEIKNEYRGVFEEDDEINLDPASVKYIILKLQSFSLAFSDIDPIGEAFEIFIGEHLRGAEGQFFTPISVINLLVEAIDPQPGDIILDPACGSGGFLSVAINHIKRAKDEFKDPKALSGLIEKTIFGIDKDAYLADLAKKHIAIIGRCVPNIYCTNSLIDFSEWPAPLAKKIKPEGVDVILTNPPFGSKIDVGPESLRRKYKLCFKWKYDKKRGTWKKTSVLQKKTPPQILFIERCLQLLRTGGKLGIILPESVFSCNNYRYVVEYIRSHAKILAIISLPEELFKVTGKSGTHTKTCAVILEKIKDPKEAQDYDIFMAEAEWCGHDSRGLPIPYNDLPKILELYKNRSKLTDYNHLGFNVNIKEIEDSIFIPKYYNPDIKKELDKLKQTHHLITVKELIDQGIISVSTGDEIGKLSYGTGNIPFVRSSDISNWEIKVDPKHCVSEEIYNKYKDKQDIRENDILLVKDGTYLVGTPAIITRYDTKIVIQSHLYKIRVKDPKRLNPFLLLAILSSDIVQKQIKAKKFSQDIIDSLGSRFYEIVLPIPKDENKKEKIISDTKKVIEARVKARELMKKIRKEVVS